MSIFCRTAVLAVPALGAMLLGAPGVRAGSYTFQTIDNPSDPTFNQLLGINNAGTIAGYFGSGAAGHPNKGYLTTPPYSGFTPENVPASVQTQVTGLNNNGVTVGFFSDTNNGPPLDSNIGFYDKGGAFTPVIDPSTPNVAVPVNQLLGVNDHNVAVGFYTDASNVNHGYTYTIGQSGPSAFAPVTVTGGSGVVAAGINNAGVIAGSFVSNASGATEGFIENANGTGLITFEAPGSTNTSFLGINNNGEVVGTYIGPNGNTHGFVYLNDTFIPVNDPLGLDTSTVNGVNDRGQLVGFYTDAAGNVDGFLADPVPEPPALAAFALGGLLLVAARRRYRGAP